MMRLIKGRWSFTLTVIVSLFLINNAFAAEVKNKVVKRKGNRVLKEYNDYVTGMEFVFVKEGCFQMGDTFGDGELNEKPVHEVCVDDFYMGKYEVTVRTV